MGTKELILIGIAMLLSLTGISVGYDTYQDKKFMAKVTSTVSALQQVNNWANTWTQMNAPRFDNANINIATMKTDLDDMSQVTVTGTGTASAWQLPFDSRFTISVAPTTDGRNRIFTISASGSEWTTAQKGKFETIFDQKMKGMGALVTGLNSDGVLTAQF